MNIQQQVIRTALTEIFFDDHKILRLKPKVGSDIDESEVKACFQVYREMGIGPHNKVLQLMDAQENMTMTREDREYAAINGNDFFIASAIVTNNLSVRLIANFFVLFYKDRTVPFRLFGDIDSATQWLLKFRK